MNSCISNIIIKGSKRQTKERFDARKYLLQKNAVRMLVLQIFFTSGKTFVLT